MKIAEFTSRFHEETGRDEQNTWSLRPISTGIPITSDERGVVLSALHRGEGGAEIEVGATPDAEQDQDQDQDLPTCDKCAKVVFPSHSGIAFFAKVGFQDNFFTRVMTVDVAL